MNENGLFVTNAPILVNIHVKNNCHLSHSAALVLADEQLKDITDDLIGKDKEIFCAAQSCRTFATHFDLSRAVQKDPALSYMWVHSMGKSSIVFHHAIILPRTQFCLGLVTRVMVRRSLVTGQTVDCTARERERFILRERTHSLFTWIPDHKLMVPIPERVPMETALQLPQQEQALLQVVVGPQHANENHVDHAALADMALQGIYLKGWRRHDEFRLTIQYLKPASINQTVHVHASTLGTKGELFVTIASRQGEILVHAIAHKNKLTKSRL